MPKLNDLSSCQSLRGGGQNVRYALIRQPIGCNGLRSSEFTSQRNGGVAILKDSTHRLLFSRPGASIGRDLERP